MVQVSLQCLANTLYNEFFSRQCIKQSFKAIMHNKSDSIYGVLFVLRTDKDNAISDVQTLFIRPNKVVLNYFHFA